jgi:predicted MFS family arabinose efflux permease
MNITNLLQKSLMTATFVIVPLEFLARFQDSKLIWLYLPALILGVFAMAPSAIFAEKKNKFKEVLMVGIMIFAISYFTLGFFDSKLSFILGVALFFIAFNVHEPIMQSLTSKIAKANQRGTALGIFNSFGYFGTFVGGLGGSMFVGDLMSLAILVIVISILWLLLVSRMENPANIKILFLNESEYSNIESIKTLNGVIEAFIKEAQIVIKYDIKTIKEREILEFLSNNK